MEASTKPEAGGAVAVVAEDPLMKIFNVNKHQAHSAEDLVKRTDPKSAKDPAKLAASAEEIKKKLDKLVEEKQIREVAPGSFKARLYFDEEHMIEHAFLGGMEGIDYMFEGPLFRLNIGVLSAFIIKDAKKNDWMIVVRDSTIGKDYCLPGRITDGTYVIGSKAPESADKNFLYIPGRYIAPRHAILTLSGEKIKVEDQRTLNGTRVDHLTEDGLERFRDLAREFLKATKKADQSNRVKRGRFVLNHFVEKHKAFEATFFNAVVDSLLLAG